jgi:hypothetical protein
MLLKTILETCVIYVSKVLCTCKTSETYDD